MTDTGVVVLNDDRSLIKAMSIKTTKKHGQDDTRAAFIVEAVMEVVMSYADTNKVRVCIEDIPFNRGRATGKIFTRYGIYATLKYLLRKAGIETYSVTPTTLKNKFAGHGHAGKDAIAAAIRTRYHHVITNDNIADAFAAASICIAHLREKLKLVITKMPLE
jgi:Holliday junction resolvasome RuvABC endonuclease subunit